MHPISLVGGGRGGEGVGVGRGGGAVFHFPRHPGFLRSVIPKDIGCVWEGRDWGGGRGVLFVFPFPSTEPMSAG